MKPTIAIGDVHGLDYWKGIVKEHPGKRIVFLGDYLDPYYYIPSSELIENLQHIIALKVERGDDVVLLLGNHDVHYFEEDAPMGTRYNPQIVRRAMKLFSDNRNLFMYAFQDGHTIFTHAGISQQWFTRDFEGNSHGNIADQLNCPHGERQRQAILRVGCRRGGWSGDVGGILWADIDELTDPLHGYTQVVGHNRVTEVITRQGTVPDTKIIFCDCLRNGNYLLIEE